ncbi:MAG: hypothetical protein A2901_01845 [Elusimicrobia bacterium RIFCSPLOWO2_01_FULL_54_10]|nr:MAG: hypothetical protein A2901_01845 [Elusimicrobia bacterium RIFCSPLOWO2_01_FULL_54_10]
MNDQALDILLVDDTKGDAKLAIRAFADGKIAHRMHCSAGGQEALDYIRDSGAPDFILLDIEMPVMDGFGTLKKLKADPNLAHIPVAMLTSSTNEEDVLKSYNFGAVSFITKPMNFEGYAQLVENFNQYWLTSSRLPK